MKLQATTPCNVFKIKSPIWDGRKVGLATYKIGTHNEVRILTKNKDGEELYPQPLYISGAKAKKFPIQPVKRNPNIKLHIIPISELEPLERNAQ